MVLQGVSGLIWDLDGTLLNSFEIFEKIIADVVVKSGHAVPSKEFIRHNYHGSLEENIQAILGIKSAAELDVVITTFLKEQGNYYNGDLNSHLFKDATMLAQQAASQGIHQILVTNREHKGRGTASPRVIIAATVLADCIDEVYPADEVLYRKPDKRSVAAWMDANQLQPEQVVVIGDQTVDAELAINLGARAILLERGNTIPRIEELRTGPSDSLIVVDTLDTVALFR